eukprot:m51a1_g7292 hypothetical protein (714) ;mRNA; r:56060-58269
MKVSFRALLVATVCAAVWIPIIIVIVLFNYRAQGLLTKATEQRLPPNVIRLADAVVMSLESVEDLAKHVASDISVGSLPLDDSPESLHGLRVRWHDLLSAFNCTTDVNYVTSEYTEHPGRMTGLVEYTSGESVWWWSHLNSTLTQWGVNTTTHDLISQQWMNDYWFGPWLEWVHTVIPSNMTECWIPIYAEFGQLWISYVADAWFPSAFNLTQQTLYAYAMSDIVIGEIASVFSGLTVNKGIAVVVDVSTMMLLGSTSAAVPVFRIDGDWQVAILINETLGSAIEQRAVAAMNRLVEEKYGSWLEMSYVLDPAHDKPTAPVRVDVPGSRSKYLVSFSHVKRNCLSWVVGVVAEQDSVTVDVIPIIVAVITTVAALACLALLSVLLTTPLAKLTHRMDAATRLTFNKREEDVAIFAEFRTLNESFKKLSTGIEAMTKFVPMPVVSQIMSNSMSIAGNSSQDDSLIMSMKRVTIMFCDIRGFTTLSEKLEIKAVIQMLFEWLGAFTKVIIKNNGIVDKYIGDCIMALWNAPLDTERPEAKACLTALEFAEVQKVLNERFMKEGLPEFGVRVGIHTGELYVGNIGCEDHINYTVCGTPANIAARMEQLGKVYGLTPLVSGDVKKCVQDQIVCVWIDDTKLRGHQTTVTRVYHIVAPLSEATPTQLQAARVMSEISDHFANQDVEQARRCVEEALSDSSMKEYHGALSMLTDKLKKM